MQANTGDIPLGTVQRYQLLQQFADILPESARLAHERGILARHHTELMTPNIMKEVRNLVLWGLSCALRSPP